jgi:predicted nucleic acid-binding protein
MRLYLDASAIIYSLEGAPAVRDAAIRRIEQAEQSGDGAVITSQLSRLECRVKPLRDGATQRLARFDAFFVRPTVVLAEVSGRVIERATELRAQHGFKTPDAIHLATALVHGADVFLTGDTALARCPGVEIAILDPTLK